MISTNVSIQQIITCSVPGPRNNFGRPKLVLKTEARDNQLGIWAYCKTCQQPHWYSKKQIIEMWDRDGVVQCGQDEEREVG